jgi:hypothetical protein
MAQDLIQRVTRVIPSSPSYSNTSPFAINQLCLDLSIFRAVVFKSIEVEFAPNPTMGQQLVPGDPMTMAQLSWIDESTGASLPMTAVRPLSTTQKTIFRFAIPTNLQRWNNTSSTSTVLGVTLVNTAGSPPGPGAIGFSVVISSRIGLADDLPSSV